MTVLGPALSLSLCLCLCWHSFIFIPPGVSPKDWDPCSCPRRGGLHAVGADRWLLAMPICFPDSGGVPETCVTLTKLISCVLAQTSLLFRRKGFCTFLTWQKKSREWLICVSLPVTIAFRPLVVCLSFAVVYKDTVSHQRESFSVLCVHPTAACFCGLFCFGLLSRWEMSAVVSLERMHLMMLLMRTHRAIQRSTH